MKHNVKYVLTVFFLLISSIYADEISFAKTKKINAKMVGYMDSFIGEFQSSKSLDGKSIYTNTIGENVNYLYKSVDDGKTWFKTNNIAGNHIDVNKYRCMNTVSVHPQNGEKLIAFTGCERLEFDEDSYDKDFYSGLFFSDNGGKSWKIINTSKEIREKFEGVYKTTKFDPINPNVIYVVTSHKIYKSENFGKDYKEIFNFIEKSIVLNDASEELDDDDYHIYAPIDPNLEISNNNPNELYVSAYGVIYKSNNSGATWEKVYLGAEGNNDKNNYLEFINKIIIDKEDSSKILVLSSNPFINLNNDNEYTKFSKSLDGGKSWNTKIISNYVGFTFMDIDPNNSDNILIGLTHFNGKHNYANGSILLSKDSGYSFTSHLTFDDILGVIDAKFTNSVNQNILINTYNYNKDTHEHYNNIYLGNTNSTDLEKADIK